MGSGASRIARKAAQRTPATSATKEAAQQSSAESSSSTRLQYPAPSASERPTLHRDEDEKKSSIEAPTNVMQEMPKDLIQEMERFDDLGRRELQTPKSINHSTDTSLDTAISYRKQYKSLYQESMPQDRTSAVVATEDEYDSNLQGHLTFRQLRQALALHYQDPKRNTTRALAVYFGMEEANMQDILANVGPPNVKKLKETEEYPVGVWYPTPEE